MLPPTELPAGPQPVEAPLPIKDLATVLIKHYGLHAGRYEVLVEFQLGVGAFGPDAESRCPGAFVAVSKVGLFKAQETSTSAVDAAVVNPAKKKRTPAQ
jgi:hypothetical protein